MDQAILGLTLICHSPFRGVSEFCSNLLDWPVSLGKVHNVLQEAVPAPLVQPQQDLSAVRIGAHDEIFQSGRPVLVGADVEVYLLLFAQSGRASRWRHAEWLRRDILSLTGPQHATRCALLRLRRCRTAFASRSAPTALAHGPCFTNQRDDLLAFAAQLDQDLAKLAAEFQLPVTTVREASNTEALDLRDPGTLAGEAALREQLSRRFFAVSVAVAELADQTVRASSVIENLNSRLRSYFFLRRHLGPDYLTLLQFFLNHHRFLRSERPERVGKSPGNS